jgi:hypothetical protein
VRIIFPSPSSRRYRARVSNGSIEYKELDWALESKPLFKDDGTFNMDAPEPTPATNKFKEDIPSEGWLDGKIEDAIERGTNKAGSPSLGSTTGYFEDLKPIKLPLETTKNVKGYNGEHLRLDQSKVDKLTKELEVDGEFKYPPLIGIAHNGKPQSLPPPPRLLKAQCQVLSVNHLSSKLHVKR